MGECLLCSSPTSEEVDGGQGRVVDGVFLLNKLLEIPLWSCSKFLEVSSSSSQSSSPWNQLCVPCTNMVDRGRTLTSQIQSLQFQLSTLQATLRNQLFIWGQSQGQQLQNKNRPLAKLRGSIKEEVRRAQANSSWPIDFEQEDDNVQEDNHDVVGGDGLDQHSLDDTESTQNPEAIQTPDANSHNLSNFETNELVKNENEDSNEEFEMECEDVEVALEEEVEEDNDEEYQPGGRSSKIARTETAADQSSFSSRQNGGNKAKTNLENSFHGFDGLVENVEYYKKALDDQIKSSPRLAEIVSDCNSKGVVDSSAASILVSEFVFKFVDLKGDSPSTKQQKLLAQAIIQILPCWKYPGTTDGIDILYDSVGRSGLIQARLRFIHKNLKKRKSGGSNAYKKRRKVQPTSAGTAGVKKSAAEIPYNKNLVVQLNKAKNKKEIEEMLRATLEHRNQLRALPSTADHFFKIYPKFMEYGDLVCYWYVVKQPPVHRARIQNEFNVKIFKINMEFKLLYPEVEANFRERWPNFANKLLKNCTNVCKSPSLLKFLSEDVDKWDPSTAGLFVLLHLIPPTVQGKGKIGRCSIDDAKVRLVANFKTDTHINSILDSWGSQNSQPVIIYQGDNPLSPQQYFVVFDKMHFPINARNPTEALDVLFKSHFVFGAEYDVNLTGLWKFIQVHIYNLNVESTHLPTKVKQVYLQLSSLL